MNEVTFSDEEGNQFLGTLALPQHCQFVVIMSHGFSSSKNSKTYIKWQEMLNTQGIGTFRIDYYGHGKNYCEHNKFTVSQDITLTKAVNSLKAAVAYIHNRGTYGIGLVGHSFGGLISFLVAAQDPKIKALALKSPVAEPISFWKKRLGEKRLRAWKKDRILHYNELGEHFELEYHFWEDLQTYDTLESARHINCPTIIIHGGKDTVVPIENSRMLAHIIGTEVQVVEGADHDYAKPEQQQQMNSLIVDFFTEKR